jgi:hypothetical protein
MKRGVNEKQPFERLEISKEDLLRLFGVCEVIIISYSTTIYKLVFRRFYNFHFLSV